MKKYLGIDIGTTSLKAAVFDENGKRLGLRSLDYKLDTDAKSGYIEFDAEKYFSMCEQVIDELTLECGEISALSVDTQGETLILADEDGNPLMPAIVWLDNRATKEARDIKNQFGEKRVYEITGQPEIVATWPASKLLWVKNAHPEIFCNIKKIFMLEDWILYRLTGNFVTEPTIQSSTIYFDINKKEYWREMLDYIGIKEEMLPSVVKSATKVGTYKGISVVSGALDQIAGTIGVGVIDESRISEMTGTIMAICLLKNSPPPYREGSVVPCHLHALDGKYCMIMWSSTAGMARKWFREQFAPELSFKEIDALAEKVNAGCDGMSMLPYFCGSVIPNYDPNATATFSGVTLSHTKAHFARSIMEAVAFMLRQNLEYADADENSELRITGGGASSPLWSQIKADVTKRKLYTVEESETACLGTAILSMVGDGRYSSIEEAVIATVKTKKVYAPTETDYETAYDHYCQLDNKLHERK
jgi:xylulokinase